MEAPELQLHHHQNSQPKEQCHSPEEISEISATIKDLKYVQVVIHSYQGSLTHLFGWCKNQVDLGE